jgi:hypothetical protein
MKKRGVLMRKILAFLTLLIFTFSMTVSTFASDSVSGNNVLNISNVDDLVPRESIINQEIIYVAGVPVLFESYIEGDFIIDIGSMLEATEDGYRVIRSGEDVDIAMPRNIDFMDMVLTTHDELRQIDSSSQFSTESTEDVLIAQNNDARFISNSGNRNVRSDSAPRAEGSIWIPGTRVEQWFPWQINTILIGTEVWVGNGGMRASVLQIAPAANLTLTETITLNRTAISPSFPFGFGVGLSPHVRTYTISASDTLFVSATRGSFQNLWPVPTLWSTLVEINTSASTGIRTGIGVSFGHPASITGQLAQGPF